MKNSSDKMPRPWATITSIAFALAALFSIWTFTGSSYQMRGLVASSLFLVFFTAVTLIAYKAADFPGRVMFFGYIVSLSILTTWEFIAFRSDYIVPRIAFLSFIIAPFLTYTFFKRRKVKGINPSQGKK